MHTQSLSTHTHSFVFKTLSNFRIHGLIDVLIVGQTSLPSGRGGCLQTTEEQSPRRGRQERHLKVLGNGVVWGELTGREHVLCVWEGLNYRAQYTWYTTILKPLAYVAVCVWTNCFLGMYIKTYQSMFWVARSTADHVTTYHNRQKQPKSMFSVQHYNMESLLEFHLDGSKQLIIHSYPVQLISQPHTWRCMSVYLGSRDLVPWRGASVRVTQVRAELQYSFLEVDGFVHIKPLQ